MTDRRYRFKERRSNDGSSMRSWLGWGMVAFLAAFGWRVAGALDARNIDTITLLAGIAAILFAVAFGMAVAFNAGRGRSGGYSQKQLEQPPVVVIPQQSSRTGEIGAAPTANWEIDVEDDREYV